MSHLPPLLPTPPASLKLRAPDVVESRWHKPCPVKPLPQTSSSQRRAELPTSSSRRRERTPPSSSVWQAEQPPAKRLRWEAALVRPRGGEVDAILRRGVELAAGDGRDEGEMTRSSSGDELFEAKRPNRNHCNCKYPEISSAAVEGRLDPAIRGDGQKLDNEKMEGKNQNDRKTQSRSARRKKNKRQLWAKAINEMREIKRDQLLEKIKKLQACVWLLGKEGADMAEIMEFRSLLESAERQYAENEAQSAKKGLSASHEGLNKDKHEKMDTISSCGEEKDPKISAECSQKVPLENCKDQHVETMAAPLEKVDPAISEDGQNLDFLKIQEKSQNDHKVENYSPAKVDRMFRRDGQSMDSEKLEGGSQNGCKVPNKTARCKRCKRLIRLEAKAAAMEAVSKQNELAEEVNYLKSELQLVRQDRACQLAQVQSLMADIEKQKEIARRCAVELDNAMRKVSALEEGCLSQRETIRTLQIQLASANEKLTELNCQERRDHDV